MRSSKSRSRSKSHRNRPTAGNIVNRVFDSSGPEGKVRGTPQQIIDKYNQLARDAQLSGDRVATENFQQHSEHYTRMLAEAQREMDEKREQQEQQFRDRQQQSDQRGQGRGDQARAEDQTRSGDQPRAEEQPRRSEQPRMESQPQPEVRQQPAPRAESSTDVLDLGGGDSDSGLVETPESKPAPKPRTRRPRKSSASKTPAATDAPDGPKADGGGDAGSSEAAE